MTTHWGWVRHGPTHEKNFVGWRDVPADLSDTARLSRLNRYLPEDAVVVSSDLIRASATADAIGQGRTRIANAGGIKEFNFGDWDGVDFATVAERHPDLSRKFWEEPGAIRAPNGESWDDVSARVARVVGDLNAQHAGQHIIAVAHIGVIMTQIQLAGRMTPYQALGHQIENLSVTRISFTAPDWSITDINHVP